VVELNRLNRSMQIPACRRYPWLWNCNISQKTQWDCPSPIEDGVTADDISRLCNDYKYNLTVTDRHKIARHLPLKELDRLRELNIPLRADPRTFSMNINMTAEYLRILWNDPLNLNDRCIEDVTINMKYVSRYVHVDELMRHPDLKFVESELYLNESINVDHISFFNLNLDHCDAHNLLKRGDINACVRAFRLQMRYDIDWVQSLCSHPNMTADLYRQVRKYCVSHGVDMSQNDAMIYGTISLKELIKLRTKVHPSYIYRRHLTLQELEDALYLIGLVHDCPRVDIVSSLSNLNILQLSDEYMDDQGWCPSMFKDNSYYHLRFPRLSKCSGLSPDISLEHLDVSSLRKSGWMRWNDIVSHPNLTERILRELMSFMAIDWSIITSPLISAEVLWDLSQGNVLLKTLMACRYVKVSNLEKYLRASRTRELLKHYMTNLPYRELEKMSSDEFNVHIISRTSRQLSHKLIMKHYTEISDELWDHIQMNCIVEDLPKFNREIKLCKIVRSYNIRLVDLNRLSPGWLRELQFNPYLKNALSVSIHPDDRTHPCLSILGNSWPYRTIHLELFMKDMTPNQIKEIVISLPFENRLPVPILLDLLEEGYVSLKYITQLDHISVKDRYHIQMGMRDIVRRSHESMRVVDSFKDIEVITQ